MNSKLFLGVSTALAAMAAFADPSAPQATIVSVSQSQSMREVIATYTLDEPAIITFDVKTNGVSIGKENLGEACGDVYRVVKPTTNPGEVRTICWAAERACKGKQFASGSVAFEVVAWATNAPPDYMVVSLTDKTGYPVGTRMYYTAPEQLPDGGVTNAKYKTDYLVMRLIPAKNAIFPMGLRTTKNEAVWYHRVKLTNDFYMAVYELTLGQFKNVTGSAAEVYSITQIFPSSGYSGNMANPLAQTTYASFRGTTKVWPGDVHEIDANCSLQKFRSVLGIGSLDLPTEAEWEFACRAGTATDRYDGVNVSSGTEPLPTDIAWLRNNSTMYYRWSEEWGLPHEVGLLRPNAFGLYDTLGNVGKVCLDLYNVGEAYCTRNDALDGEPVVAPIGPKTDVKGEAGNATTARHVMRGSACNAGIWAVLAYNRGYQKANQSYPCNENVADGNLGPYGYRLVCLP